MQRSRRQPLAIVALLTLCGATSAAIATVLMQGPQYVYKLTVNRDPSLCSHMDAVFNSRFATLWNTPMLIEGDPALAADSPYALPRLPGVDHNDRATFTMLRDKMPSAPEFDAIPWKEGRAIYGEPKESAPPQNDTPMPILVTWIDFFNDGHVDTVIKSGFTPGYSYMANSDGSGLESDLIQIIRKEDVPVGSVLSWWTLRQTVPEHLIYRIGGAHQRLFLFERRVYVARYDIDVGPGGSDTRHAPWRPHKELMSVLRYSLPADASELQVPEQETVCEFRMIQQPKAAKQ